MKLLVVDDELETLAFLKQGLEEEGFVVDTASTAPAADEALAVNRYDAIVLDAMLPGGDGFELCRQWRGQGVEAPIVFLTARDRVSDRVRGLDLGADDYVVKPFAFEELVARLRAHLRRPAVAPRETLEVGPLRLDPASRQVLLDGRPLSLTAREYLILELLCRRAGRIVSRTELWENVWESGLEPNSNVVDVYVGYLRSKLGAHRDLVKTVRGSGYCLVAP
ncbi:MAG: DNA-binding response regulator [Candidatus Xenobia bacterium]